MTKELKPHQIAQLVNKLRDIATKYHAHGCLRELISREVNAALTQRPAAQTERDAFEAWFDDYHDKACAEFGGIDCTDPKGIAEEAWQARASLPAPQQATPATPEDMKVYDGIAAGYFADTQQATPEPVGLADLAVAARALAAIEVGTHDTMTAALARVALEKLKRPATQQATPSRYGSPELQALIVQHATQQATPEPVGEVVAWQRRDRNIVTGEWSEWHEDDDIEEELDPEWAERRPLSTRPAPGVPEGFALVPVEPTEEMTTAVEHAMWDKPSVKGADVWSAVLAAAQAKGDQP